MLNALLTCTRSPTGRGYMDVNRISGYLPGKMVFFLMQVGSGGVNVQPSCHSCLLLWD